MFCPCNPNKQQSSLLFFRSWILQTTLVRKNTVFNTNNVGSGRSDLAPICLSRDRAADRDRTQEDPLEELCSFRGGLGNMALPIRLRARIPVFDGAELFI